MPPPTCPCVRPFSGKGHGGQNAAAFGFDAPMPCGGPLGTGGVPQQSGLVGQAMSIRASFPWVHTAVLFLVAIPCPNPRYTWNAPLPQESPCFKSEPRASRQEGLPWLELVGLLRRLLEGVGCIVFT